MEKNPRNASNSATRTARSSKQEHSPEPRNGRERSPPSGRRSRSRSRSQGPSRGSAPVTPGAPKKQQTRSSPPAPSCNTSAFANLVGTNSLSQGQDLAIPAPKQSRESPKPALTTATYLSSTAARDPRQRQRNSRTPDRSRSRSRSRSPIRRVPTTAGPGQLSVPDSQSLAQQTSPSPPPHDVSADSVDAPSSPPSDAPPEPPPTTVYAVLGHMACLLDNHRAVAALLTVSKGALSSFRDLALQCKWLLLHKGHKALHLCINRDKPNVQLVHPLMQTMWKQLGPQSLLEADTKGNTVLHLACARGNLQVATLLITQGYLNVEDKNNRGDTALHLASTGGFTPVVKYLLEQFADANAVNGKQLTALAAACMKGSAVCGEAAAMLVHEGDAWDQDGKALHAACRRGDDSMLEMLIGDDVSEIAFNSIGETAFRLACDGGHPEVCRRLLTSVTGKRADKIKFRVAALRYACRNGANQILSVVLQVVGLLPSEDAAAVWSARDLAGNTALHFASCGGNRDTVQLLLAIPAFSPAAVNSIGQTALLGACMAGNKRTARVLLEPPNFDHVGLGSGTLQSGFLAACSKGSEGVVKLLLRRIAMLEESEALAVLNATNDRGNTGFLEACLNGNAALIQLLLSTRGVDAGIANPNGTLGGDALLYACKLGRLDIVQLLLGANTAIFPDVHKSFGGAIRQALQQANVAVLSWATVAINANGQSLQAASIDILSLLLEHLARLHVGEAQAILAAAGPSTFGASPGTLVSTGCDSSNTQIANMFLQARFTYREVQVSEADPASSGVDGNVDGMLIPDLAGGMPVENAEDFGFVDGLLAENPRDGPPGDRSRRAQRRMAAALLKAMTADRMDVVRLLVEHMQGMSETARSVPRVRKHAAALGNAGMVQYVEAAFPVAGAQL